MYLTFKQLVAIGDMHHLFDPDEGVDLELTNLHDGTTVSIAGYERGESHAQKFIVLVSASGQTANLKEMSYDWHGD